MNQKEKIVLIGAGGHAKSVIDTIISSTKFEICGMIDRNISNFTYQGINVIGTNNDLTDIYKSGIKYAFVCIGFMGGGRENVRKKIYENLLSIGFIIPCIIDKSAILASDVSVGEGTYIGKKTVLNSRSFIGKMCIINTAAVVEHDCYIDDYTHISVGAIICGTSSIGKAVLIGANSTVIQNINIEDNVIVGAGVTVIRNVKRDNIVLGIHRREKYESSNWNSSI